MRISVAVVLFCNKIEQLERLFNSLNNSIVPLNICIVDNSPYDNLRTIVENFGFSYSHTPCNPGFGASHNFAFRLSENSEFHCIVNPDVYFDENAIYNLVSYLNNEPDVQCVVPKIIYPDGRLQRLCKLLPSALNLISRRFIPLLADHLDEEYELRWFCYDKTVEIPYVSGCFMVVRSCAFNRINGFDEQFFMYLEDIDLSRRLGDLGRIVFNPSIVVTHEYAKASYKNNKLLWAHIKSTIQYFNKWGWIFDSKRLSINRRAILNIRKIMSKNRV
jgi:GT2 family glycosyltransferase